MSSSARWALHLAFVLGTDQLEKLPSWHRFPEILGLCHWIVLERRKRSSDARQKTLLTEWEGSGLRTMPRNPVAGERGRAIDPSDAVYSRLLSRLQAAQALSSTRIREKPCQARQPTGGGSSCPMYHAGYLMKRRLYG